MKRKAWTRIPGLVAAAALAASAAGARAGNDWMKDLHAEQRAMAEVRPAPASAGPAAVADGLEVEVTLDRPDARYEPGDRLTLTIETSEDSWVWVFDTGAGGKVHQLFPNRYDDDNFVRAAAPLTLPRAESDYEIVVSHPPGAELLTVVASRDNAPPARDAIDRAAAAGPFFALRGSGVTVAKDLNISLRGRSSDRAIAHTDYAVAHRVFHVR